MSGDYIQFPVMLTNTKPFRATIAWTDPPGTPVAPAVYPTNHMLVNDLDLRVVSPASVTNFPYVLNEFSASSAATTGDNTADNVEQVYIPSPSKMAFTSWSVTHKRSLLNDLGQVSYQNVSILLTGNIAQPAIAPAFVSALYVAPSNTIALKWASDVGRVCVVQTNASITSGTWGNATGELSATKTNTVIALPKTDLRQPLLSH